jgi:hypothetical protein
MQGKTFIYFQPNPDCSFAEMEHYYLHAHVPLVRGMLLQDPVRLSYYIARAVAEYDFNGGWAHPLTMWRYVYGHLDNVPSSNVTKIYDESDKVLWTRDGNVCLSALRHATVSEEILFQRTRLHGSGTKYIFDYRRAHSESLDTAASRLRSILGEIAGTMSRNEGARLLRVNWATEEAEWVIGEGVTGRVLTDSDLLAFVEFEFDSDWWASAVFGGSQVSIRLLHSAFAGSRGCKVEETCVFDKRAQQPR